MFFIGIFILSLPLFCSLVPFEIAHKIPLPTNTNTCYSPRGDLLVVIEKDRIGLYETQRGARIGNLEGIESQELSDTYRFVFSPGQTYLSYRGKIWEVSSQKQLYCNPRYTDAHLWWNESESIFIASPTNENKDYVHNAGTFELLQTITWPMGFGTLSRLNNDGSLIATLLTPWRQTPANQVYDRLKVKETLSGKETMTLSTGYCTEISFFSDNIHALVTVIPQLTNDIILIDAKQGKTLRIFSCREYLAPNNPFCNTPCSVQIHGLNSLITHPSAKDYCCTISHDGTQFQFQKHDRSMIFKKNIPEPSQEQLKALDRKEHTRSPDGYSFLLTTNKGQRFLCIAKHLYDQLAADRGSYLSLLPFCLRAYLRKFHAPDPLLKNTDTSC